MSFEYEGTWEDALTHSRELAGRRVRIQVIDIETDDYPPGVHFIHRAPPVKDLDSYLESLPRISDEDAEDLWDAIAENRAMRRSFDGPTI